MSTTKLAAPPKRMHWIIAAIFAAAALLLFIHPDVIETANHSYLFLESIFSGRLLHFYEDVMLHDNSLYYINNAHYSIVIYLIFGLCELPVFIICKLFNLAVNEVLLYFIGKLVSAGFFVAGLAVLYKIALQIGVTQAKSQWAILFCFLWPPAFFACFIMGQYDSICLLFILLALLYWLRGNMLRFSLWIGVGVACKFFPLLLVVPLVLLVEKRLLPILKYGLLTLWLTLPLNLLYVNRDGDMGFFNQLMANRIFQTRVELSTAVPLFPLLFVVLCVAAYMWHPKTEAARNTAGLWLCLTVLCLLFVTIEWHPQWLILIAPFVVLTSMQQKNRFVWLCIDILFSVGFFMALAFNFPNQFEANLLNQGLVGLLSGLNTALVNAKNSINFYYNLMPLASSFPPVLYAGALISQFVFKMPTAQGTLGTRLSGGKQSVYEQNPAMLLWVGFGLSIMVWLVPTLLTWLKCFSFI